VVCVYNNCRHLKRELGSECLDVTIRIEQYGNGNTVCFRYLSSIGETRDISIPESQVRIEVFETKSVESVKSSESAKGIDLEGFERAANFCNSIWYGGYVGMEVSTTI